jgi:hypothetical protein
MFPNLNPRIYNKTTRNLLLQNSGCAGQPKIKIKQENEIEGKGKKRVLHKKNVDLKKTFFSYV